jgi:predicted TPR repeat methyltransferase
MEGYGPETYGDRIADVYDGLYENLDTEGAVETLASLAGDGPVLELAIGTGRLALPLVERGLEVHGIDASEAMVAKLRDKSGGDRVRVTMGDFADVAVDGRYALIFVAFNTLFGLPTQDDQLRCFANVAARLVDSGVFVVEAFFPDLARFDRGQRPHEHRRGRAGDDRRRPS